MQPTGITTLKVMQNGVFKPVELHPATRFSPVGAYLSDGTPLTTNSPATNLVRVKLAGQWYPDDKSKVFYRKDEVTTLISRLHTALC